MKRPYRVVVAKPGLDGHDRGAKVIARALRDSGFEVVYTGLHQTPEQVVQAVVQEDADAVGLSLLSGAHLTLVPRVVQLLADVGRDDVLVIVGGIIPENDIPVLKEQGVAAVFTPGSRSTPSDRGWARPSTNERMRCILERCTPGLNPHNRIPAPDRDTTEGEGTASGSLRVPGQAVLRPLRHSDLTRRGRRHGRRSGRRRGRIGYPVVVKAQVQVGGRGKAGGVKLAADADEVRIHAGNILGLDIKGHIVKRLWVEHASDIEKEYYASFTLDRPNKCISACCRPRAASRSSRSPDDPDAIACCTSTRSTVSTRRRPASGSTGPPRPRGATRGRHAAGAALPLLRRRRCDLAEINPLILTPEGKVHALDAKVTLDENAAFRHPEWEEYADDSDVDPARRWPRTEA